MKNDLKRELELRGTAEISNGIINQVTQAIDEKDNEATFLIFGEKTTTKLKPIEECCAKCDFVAKRDLGIEKCQQFQKKDGEMRGFTKVICPEQFEE